MRLNFSRFFFTLSEKNILVGHIFSLCPINGKRQIFHKFFFLMTLVIPNFSERAFYYRYIIWLLITKKCIIYLLSKIQKFWKNAQNRQIEKTLRIRKNWTEHFRQKLKSVFGEKKLNIRFAFCAPYLLFFCKSKQIM